MSRRIAEIRDQVPDDGLELSDLDQDPFVEFALWLEMALAAHPGWPNAMTLATADASGAPSSRTVLLKGVDERGFTFFTNYESRKGKELAANARASLTFYWPALERQVCVNGSVERVARRESEEYFNTRPRGSRLGAWASEQSSEIEGRAELEARVAELGERFKGEIPLPDHWGGYRLSPIAFEFWRSRRNRLHDRFRYEKQPAGWRRARLSP
ncbi:MAG: pyridoxamine 5'-phosphate oxidase [Actinomycetota bacterium]